MESHERFALGAIGALVTLMIVLVIFSQDIGAKTFLDQICLRAGYDQVIVTKQGETYLCLDSLTGESSPIIVKESPYGHP